MQRPRPAIGDQHEIAGIEAALGGHRLDGVGHRGHRDTQNAVGGSGNAHAERLGDVGLERLLGSSGVEPHFAAEEAVGADPPEHQVGVGDGRRGAAEAVAGRSRLRAGALRADPQRPLLDARDRAAAGADLKDVHHGDLDRQRALIAADQRGAGG